ncbi:MAG UNVERIFIED_CONTAM: hypothetical protein MIL04_25705, partial [Klebsiella aerogenes]
FFCICGPKRFDSSASLIAAQAPYQGYVRTALGEPGSPAQRSASRGENPAIITKIAFPRVSRQLFAVL